MNRTRLVVAGETIDIDHRLPPPNLVAEIQSAFLRAETDLVAPVRELVSGEFSYEEIRQARLGLLQRGLID